MQRTRVDFLAFMAMICALSTAGCPDDDAAHAGDSGSGTGATSGGGSGGTGGSGAGGSGAGGSGGSGGTAAGSGGGSGSAGAAGAGRGGTGGSGGAGGGGMAGAPEAGTGGAAAGSGGRDFTTDRAKFFGASRCGSAGVLMCDDFESGTIDPTLWKNYQTAPKIDAMQAARGSKALHVSIGATGGSGLNTTKIFPRADGVYYGRMFVYFGALPTGPQWAHWTVVGQNPKSGSAIAGEARLGGQFDGTINRFGVGTDHGPTGDWTNLDNDPAKNAKKVPEGAWICVEWMFDTPNDQTKFWWDGTEHPSLATTRDVKHDGNPSVKYELPDIGSVWVGFENYNQGKTMLPNHYDVWIDEVAFDATRIGCVL